MLTFQKHRLQNLKTSRLRASYFCVKFQVVSSRNTFAEYFIRRLLVEEGIVAREIVKKYSNKDSVSMKCGIYFNSIFSNFKAEYTSRVYENIKRWNRNLEKILQNNRKSNGSLQKIERWIHHIRVLLAGYVRIGKNELPTSGNIRKHNPFSPFDDSLWVLKFHIAARTWKRRYLRHTWGRILSRRIIPYVLFWNCSISLLTDAEHVSVVTAWIELVILFYLFGMIVNNVSNKRHTFLDWNVI